MAISELEPSPNPFDGDFDEVADNFLGVGLPRLRVEINATEVHMEELEASAVAAAAAAAGAVGTVADSAAAAANAASLADTRATAAQAAKVAAETARDLAQTYGAALSGTSTSNLTITKVSKVFATQAGKAWTLGQRLRAASDDGTKVMEGALTDYAGTNLTVLVDYTKGTGSHADWNISVGGEQGGEGPPGSGTGTVNSVNNHEPDEDGAVVIPDATTTEAGLQSAADKTKLDGIAAGATANDTDAALRARASHTGTQAIATVTGLQAALDGKMAAAANSDAVTEGASNLYFTVQRVRDAVLTGLSLASAAAVTAADTLLVAFGKLQKQITDLTTTVSGKIDSTYLDTDVTLAANSDTKIATQKAVKAYADGLIAANDAMVFKGVIDCSANPNYPAGNRGDTYRVSVAGKIGGASGPNVEAGDLLLCLTDSTASGNHATVGANWSIVQTNLDGAVIGPASVTDGNLAAFNGATGKLIKQLTAAEVRTLLALVVGTNVQAYDANTAKLNVAQSWTAEQTFKETKDTVFTITDAAGFQIDPANGSVQVVTLGANRTPAATNFEAGQTVLLGIDDGTARTITWTTVNPTWVKPGGTASAPALATTGFTWVLLWKVGSTVYGAEVGKP